MGSCLRKLLKKLATATSDDAAIRAAADIFMFAPSVLRKPERHEPHSRSYGGLTHTIKSRVRRALTGTEMPNLYNEALEAVSKSAANRAAAARPSPRRAGRPHAPSDGSLEKRQNRRARHCFYRGDIRRAIRTLSHEGAVPIDESVRERLCELHPPPSRPFPSPPLDILPPSCTVDGEEISINLSRMDSGAAAGPDLMRPGHLKLVIGQHQSPLPGEDGAEILARLIQRFADGNFPDEVFKLYSSALLIAVPKPNFPADPKSIRPIAIGNVIRRLTSISLLQKVRAQAAAYLSPLQVGVGVKSGTECIVHEAREYARKNANPDDSIALLDAENAFNSVHRHVLVERCQQATPAIARYVAKLFRQPPKLVAPSSSPDTPPLHLLSQEGEQQGDPLSMLLFALIIHPELLRLSEKIPNLYLNGWYADDGTIAGPARATAQALTELNGASSRIGLRLNLKKTMVYVRDIGPSIPPFPCPLAAMNTGMNILGSPIGTQQHVLTTIRQKIQQIETLHRRVQLLGDPQLSFLTTRLSLNACRLTHILRTTRPPGVGLPQHRQHWPQTR